MTESYNINYIDESEYPSTTSIQNRSARAGYKVIMCYPSTTSIQDRSASGSCLYQALRNPSTTSIQNRSARDSCWNQDDAPRTAVQCRASTCTGQHRGSGTRPMSLASRHASVRPARPAAAAPVLAQGLGRRASERCERARVADQAPGSSAPHPHA